MQDDETPLHCAAARNNVDCLQMLVARGANVNVTDKVQAYCYLCRYFEHIFLLGRYVTKCIYKPEKCKTKLNVRYHLLHSCRRT